jgi:hypothetical protein
MMGEQVMMRSVSFLAMLLLVSGMACAAGNAGPEIIDPAEAAKDADFGVQGEYQGEGTLAGVKGPIGVQVIARSKGKFEAFVLKGGLPGEGWRRGDERIPLSGQREGNTTTLKGKDLQATIVAGTLTLQGQDGKTQATLKRAERKSSTLGAKAPAGAVVLFDGTDTKQFDVVHISADGNLISGTTTKPKFGSMKLHLEFRLSWMPQAQGQARSNSGVYVHDCYEIQVLDSFGLEGKDNECGGFYSVKAPDVNMCLPPMTWQTYDIDFTAPKYDAAGNKIGNARITVQHNGKVIHDSIELPKATPGRQGEGPAPRPFHLQGHGNKVEYRNVWVQETK